MAEAAVTNSVHQHLLDSELREIDLICLRLLNHSSCTIPVHNRPQVHVVLRLNQRDELEYAFSDKRVAINDGAWRTLSLIRERLKAAARR